MPALPVVLRIIERAVKNNSYQQGLFTEHIAEEMGLGLAEKEVSNGFMLKGNVQQAEKPVFAFWVQGKVLPH